MDKSPHLQHPALTLGQPLDLFSPVATGLSSHSHQYRLHSQIPELEGCRSDMRTTESTASNTKLSGKDGSLAGCTPPLLPSPRQHTPLLFQLPLNPSEHLQKVLGRVPLVQSELGHWLLKVKSNPQRVHPQLPPHSNQHLEGNQSSSSLGPSDSLPIQPGPASTYCIPRGLHLRKDDKGIRFSCDAEG